MTFLDRILFRKFGTRDSGESSERADGSTISNHDDHRDGCMRQREPTTVEKAILRRFGPTGVDGLIRAGEGPSSDELRAKSSDTVPAILHETKRLFPRAPPLTSTPPTGVHTNPTHSTRAVVARSNCTSHATPPTDTVDSLDGLTREKQECSEPNAEEAVVDEQTDLGKHASVKRREVAERFWSRAKKEVMDAQAPEDRGATDQAPGQAQLTKSRSGVSRWIWKPQRIAGRSQLTMTTLLVR